MTESRPKALDLFSGAGGAAMGLYRAGFDVTGIDNRPQPRYPFRFIQADALKPPVRLEAFDLVWASPPCQGYSSLRTMRGVDGYPKLIEKVRSMLAGHQYVIENVVGAPLINPVMICGSGLGLTHGGWQLRRHRLFECSFPAWDVQCQHAARTVGVYGDKARNIAEEKRHYSRDKDTRGKPNGVVLPWEIAIATMQTPWMNRSETSEAIPPAYAEHIGTYAMMALGLA